MSDYNAEKHKNKAKTKNRIIVSGVTVALIGILCFFLFGNGKSRNGTSVEGLLPAQEVQQLSSKKIYVHNGYLSAVEYPFFSFSEARSSFLIVVTATLIISNTTLKAIKNMMTKSENIDESLGNKLCEIMLNTIDKHIDNIKILNGHLKLFFIQYYIANRLNLGQKKTLQFMQSLDLSSILFNLINFIFNHHLKF